MIELNRSEGIVSEAAVLVSVILPDNRLRSDPLDELAGLATTAGAQIVGQLTQRREVPDITTYLGKGKVEELQQLAESTDADCIIFDNDQDNSSKLGAGTDREFFETNEGKLINSKGEKAQFIRFYSKGSTESALNEYTEIEVYGRPAK